MVQNLSKKKVWVGNDNAFRKKVKEVAASLGWDTLGSLFNDNVSFYFYSDKTTCWSSNDNFGNRENYFDTNDFKEIFAKDFEYKQELSYEIF